MKTTKSLTFMQIIFLLNCLIFSTLPILLSAQVSGHITAVKDSEGNELGQNAPTRGEVYTIEFTGFDIRDFHIRLGDETSTVCCHAGAMPEEPSECNIDVYSGSFTNCGTHTSAGLPGEDIKGGKYISLWKGGDSITSGEFQIRFNSGTPGKNPEFFFTRDGDEDPFDGEAGVDFNYGTKGAFVSDPPILISTEEVPTLSEWGVITLILLTLSMGMVFLYRRETALAVAGNIPTGTSPSKQKLFDKRLYAKVFSLVLLTGFAILGLSYLYFGGITSADPFGTFISSAIVAYMVHLWILKKSESE